MEERRKLKRMYLMFYSRVFDRKNGKFIGHLAELTAEGAMIISEEALEPGKVYSFTMDLPPDRFGKEHMMFDALAVHCKPDIDPAFFVSGFRLLDLTPEDLHIIEGIIEAFGFQDRDQMHSFMENLYE